MENPMIETQLDKCNRLRKQLLACGDKLPTDRYDFVKYIRCRDTYKQFVSECGNRPDDEDERKKRLQCAIWGTH
jgi:hypothetical protein